jgi:hypothetical protein
MNTVGLLATRPAESVACHELSARYEALLLLFVGSERRSRPVDHVVSSVDEVVHGSIFVEGGAQARST